MNANRSPASWLVFVLMLGLTVAIYVHGLGFPAVFDDGATLKRLAAEPHTLVPDWTPRWLGYYSLKVAYQQLHDPVPVARATGIVLHAVVGWMLFHFLLSVAKVGGLTVSSQRRWLALLAALLFVAHPLSVYATAYLVQRSVVVATLFALLMWWSFARGLLSGSRGWLVLSAAGYAAALMAKEHAVTAPVVCVLLAVLHVRVSGQRYGQVVRIVWPYFLACGVLAVLTALWFKGLLGQTYEPLAGELTPGEIKVVSQTRLYALSVFNQTALLLDYLRLWLLPDPMDMSIDMRPDFIRDFGSAPQLARALAVLVAGVVAVVVLLAGKRGRWAAFSFLSFFGLFLVEFSVVRLQEPFVLYRAYFWMAPAFALIWAVPERFYRGGCLIMGVLVVAFALLSFQRLETFKTSFALWDDAIAVAERRGWTDGVSRIYANRAGGYAAAMMYPESLKDYDRAIGDSSGEVKAFHCLNKARMLLDWKKPSEALVSAEASLRLYPTIDALYIRGVACEKLGNQACAADDFKQTCEAGIQIGCLRLQALNDARKTLQPE